SSKIDIAAAMQDHVIGDEKAPVTIVEYASFTCPHCAHFETDILPQLKASMMTRCISPLQYYNMVQVVFSRQESWTKAKDPLAELAQLASLAGMDADEFKSCTENSALETAILNSMQKAQSSYGVSSTPTFVFNDGAEKITGAQDVDKFEATVNKLTK